MYAVAGACAAAAIVAAGAGAAAQTLESGTIVYQRGDFELEREGRLLDLVHALNVMRKDAGLELTDRIRVTLPRPDDDLLPHADWIARETLAVAVELGDVSEPRIEKA